MYALYSQLLPILAVGEPELEVTFAAAWGVGNMGLDLLLVTCFWLWEPALALVGGIPRSPNQPLQAAAGHGANGVA